MQFQRYAIFYTATGALAARGAHWLGWDIARGAAVDHPCYDGIDMARITQRPRKYGFHGTIKAPFRLGEAQTPQALIASFAQMCRALPPAEAGALELSCIGRFVALIPADRTAQLRALSSHVVETLDPFRAPLTPAEMAKRRPERLTQRQRSYLESWGYPFIKDDFKFHMTLTGHLEPQTIEPVRTAAQRHFGGALPDPLRVDALTLAGEDAQGRFHQIDRRALTGVCVT